MKILIVTTVSVTLNFFETQVKELIHMGNEVHVCSNFSYESNVKIDSRVKTQHIDFSRSLLNLENYKAYKQLKSFLKENDFDIIHTHTPIASAIVRLQSKKNTRMIYTAHGFHFYKGAPLKNWLLFYPIEKYLSRRTDDLITINKEDYNIAKKKFKMNRVHLINGPGVDIESIKKEKRVNRKELGLTDADFVLIFGAELNENKNQYLLIDSVNLLIKKYPNIKLLLVGQDNNNSVYQAYVKKLNLENCIYFLGMRTDLKGIIKSCDLAVSSSKREGLGLFLIEAGLNGLPILATDNRGSREIVKEGINGYLSDFSKENFTIKLEKLILTSDKLLKNENEIKKIYQKFSSVNVNKKIFNIYRDDEFGGDSH